MLTLYFEFQVRNNDLNFNKYLPSYTTLSILTNEIFLYKFMQYNDIQILVKPYINKNILN